MYRILPSPGGLTRTLDVGLNSINAISPDPNTLMAITVSDCTSDTPRNNQSLVTRSIRDEIVALAAQATAAAPCLKTLIASHLRSRKPGANQQAPCPCGDNTY
jgi:hypothetical protein